MNKRIIIVLAVATAVAAALFAGVVLWIERSEKAEVGKAVDPASISPEAAEAREAFRIDREGRKLADGRPRSEENLTGVSATAVNKRGFSS